MAYLLDANVFIDAKNYYYGLDFCPAFWAWIIEQHGLHRVYSIDKILTELQGHDDDLAAWALERGHEFFLRPDPPILESLRNLAAWVTTQRYEASAINAFLDDPDYYLVAHALAHGHEVVTREKLSNSTKKVKIPEACIGVGVSFLSPFEMLRRERARFVLGAPP